MIDWLDAALTPGLPAFFAGQRWFGAKSRTIARIDLRDAAALAGDGSVALVVADVRFTEGVDETYVLIVARRRSANGLPVIAELSGGTGVVVEASADSAAAFAFLSGFASGRPIQTRAGAEVAFTDVSPAAVESFAGVPPAIAPIGAEQSNTSLRVDRRFIFKLFRRLEWGENPEVEIGRFLLNRTNFRAVPPLAGTVSYLPGIGEPSTLGVLQDWVESTGDGWSYVTNELVEALHARDRASALDGQMTALGQVTAEFHEALSRRAGDEAFTPEPVTEDDAHAWREGLVEQAARTRRLLDRASGDWPEAVRASAEVVRRAWPGIEARANAMASVAPGSFSRIRIHGDYHLGQTLKTSAGFAIIDLEGEPRKPIAVRRHKSCALRDVAGMLRSFDYAVEHVAGGDVERARLIRSVADLRAPFLRGYFGHAATRGITIPADSETAARWLGIFELEKALYELQYEIDHRPDWVSIPLGGLERLLTFAA